MNTINFTFQYAGRTFAPDDFEDTWEMEFNPEETALFAALDGIDVESAETITAAKTPDGLWFLLWSIRHPEMVTVSEWFEQEDRSSKFPTPAEIEAGKMQAFHEMKKRLPDTHHFRTLTRKEAGALVAWYCLPPEFHKDYGVSPA